MGNGLEVMGDYVFGGTWFLATKAYIRQNTSSHCQMMKSPEANVVYMDFFWYLPLNELKTRTLTLND